eukprot:TRINITY_DN7202_c0_g3_i1.p2 TRINITY_DN7202_c0_g3~~TRINITY_DN7202_c0_g3_i1.p2  ORF type:complete len:152 (-),score=45.54 TRINITY_DN7202_c0_g3_i1:68-523(-)
MLGSNDFAGIVKFFAESLEEVVKGECRAAGVAEHIGSDLTVLLDSCVLRGVVTEHMYASLVRVKEVSRKVAAPVVFVPDAKPTQLVKSNSWKYDVCSLKGEKFSKEDAMETLMIAYDFLLEHQTLHNDHRYEPYLSSFRKDFIEPLQPKSF